jgi:hypothetical protein
MVRGQILFQGVWTFGMWGKDHLCCLARLCEIARITEVEQVSIDMKKMAGVIRAVFGKVRLFRS